MVSMLGAFGAGMVIGAGNMASENNKREADKKDSLDKMRAEKLVSFDFDKQLLDSKLQAEIKMKEMEIENKHKGKGNALEIFEQMKKNRDGAMVESPTPSTTTPTLEAPSTSKWNPAKNNDDTAVEDSYDMQIAANLANGDLPKATDVENEKLRWQQTNKKDLMKGDSTYRDAWLASIKDSPLYHPALNVSTHKTVGNAVKADLITTGDIVYNSFIANGVDKDSARNVTDDFVKLYGKVVIPSSSASFNRGETDPLSKTFKPAYAGERDAASQELLQAMESNGKLAKVIRERNAPLYNYIKSIQTTKDMVNKADGTEVTGTVMPNKVYKSAAEVMADTSLGTPQDRVKKVRELGLK